MFYDAGPMKISVITPTHDTTWLAETWQSLRSQEGDWEWVVLINSKDDPMKPETRMRLRGLMKDVKDIVEGDARVRVIEYPFAFTGVGALKRYGFFAGEADILLELDHDDLLLPGALAAVSAAFEENPDVGFVYSDCIDFEDKPEVGVQGEPTYLGSMRLGFISNGFEFYWKDVEGVRPGRYQAVRSFPPSAAALSLIFWAPNHLRAWRTSVYREIGGHDKDYAVCDDHELLVRTYLATKMLHLPEPYYLYRVSGNNTWLKSADEIRRLSYTVRAFNLHKLVAREAGLRGLPVYDLGGYHGGLAGWTPVDSNPRIREHGGIEANLSERWPFDDNSVFAFRANDFIEHLPNKMHTMSEIHRCLVPGGWLLSETPSTDGRGAFQDPTHVSYWNENAFWYWTRGQVAKYIGNESVRFQEMRLETLCPSKWHEENKIPYVYAYLVALKGQPRGCGEIFI